MNEALQQFHFLRPLWLVALVALPLLFWFGMRRSSVPLELSRLVDAELLPHLLRGRAANRYVPAGLFAMGWTLCALALAGPTWNRVAQPLYASRAAQVVAISLSQHMLSRDVAPSRLDRVRYKVHDLLASNRDGLNALIGYAGEAFVVAPLTADADSLGDLLNAMSPDTMPVDGNDAALAIQRGAALIHDANVPGGSLVLITDQADAAAAAAARVANAAGVRVSVLGVGTAQGGPIPQASGGFLRDEQDRIVMADRDDAALVALAAAGGGRYAPMTTDAGDIDALKSELRAGPSIAAAGQVGDEWQDRGPWLLPLLLLVVALAFRRGWLLLLPLILLPMLPGRADATDWRDLWQRPDQQAAQTLRQGGPAKQAQQLARDPAWRGAADYRAADYAAAAKTLQPLPGTNAAYNRGNALARQGQYSEAIDAYQQALKIDPANADAAANKKAVEDWLKQQQQQDQKNKNQQQKQDSSNSKKPDSGGDQGQPKPDQQGSDASQKPDQKPSQDAGKPSDKSGQNGQPDSQKQPSQDPSKPDQSKPDQTGDDSSAKNQSAEQPKPLTPQQQAEQKASADKAQQALQKQMDQALAGQPKDQQGKLPPTHQLGEMSKDDPDSKLPADLRQAIQRVPDDPGALLRRKFQLEYEQRHGGVPNEDDQP
ncbi:tetratricopeptide repeat protein [Rhodanobacter sp. MP1X3]|uniref:tetratricopeptide repeat protein n=1 Tax=Rhodanobacter sp. MP1X3 TaxID=2723086 RepID=UPI00161AE47A|nr:tetratricopeptide repeat protein [Rhodanobacter sp. MP1X3]MBB6241326.1 Ca-activated chloride channel family protein [Rhodanobacter sp. MP1X3]